MDKLERELRQDADRVRPEVTPELRARIDAALRVARQERREARRARPGGRFWWFSALTGVAATLLVVVLMNRGGTLPQENAARTPSPAVAAVPDVATDIHAIPLHIRHADFAEPLEDELEKLKSDLEKARDEVRRDMRFSF